MRADDILKDDQTNATFGNLEVRKGTVAAFLGNARIWCDPATAEADRRSVEADIREAIPSLRAVGLFEVLSVRDERLARMMFGA